MDIDKLLCSLHPLERKVLPAIARFSSISDLAKRTQLKEVEVMRALQWLENRGMLCLEEAVKEVALIDKNGIAYAKEGLPERRFLNALQDRQLSLGEIASKARLSKEELSVSLGALKSKAAIEIKKGKEILVSLTDNGKALLVKELPEERFLKKEFPVDMVCLSDDEKYAVGSMKDRRGIIRLELRREKAPKLTALGREVMVKNLDSVAVVEKLTPQMLKDGSWENSQFRYYDVGINVPGIYAGKRHFVSQATSYIKKIWLDMGFKEMEGSMVQTSFWDLDALFVPQDHPARDMQDTFYIKNPPKGNLPSGLVEKVSSTHENGWTTGSKGWQYRWSGDIARDNLLRTHTTVLSARTIANLKKSDLPAKFFSVGKVFRNETLSWKHLFEFIQVEGIVVDPDANFRNLQGYLKEFFAKMGFTDVRIRPGHFPYTEPSAEVDVWHPKKKQWVELGGSGIFRPEVVKPLLGFECPVLAWGLGMERTIMDYYGLSDIRDIYSNDLKMLREIRAWVK